MLYAVSAVVGIVVGGVVAWVISASRIRRALSTRLEASEQKANQAEGQAGVLSATLDELRREGEERSQKAAEDFKKLRNDLAAESEGKVRAETHLQDARKHFEEEKKLLAEAKSKLSDAFKALAKDTLESSNKAFLDLAKENLSKILSDAKGDIGKSQDAIKTSNQELLKLTREHLEKILAETKGDLGKRQEAIKGFIKPLDERLKAFDEHIRNLEKSREKAYGGLEEQLKSLTSSQQLLQKETSNLVTALRAPQVRGRWGEMTLRRVVELAGMSAHCDFSEQVSVTTEDGRIRPDMIVHLPADREIVVDSKVSLEAYLSALSAETEEERQSFLAAHARQTRGRMTSLGGKKYWEQFDKAPEFVVMFIPGESFFAAAVDQDHNLIEDGMKSRVVLATPTTLIALLHAVAYGWRQEQIAENAKEISDLGKQVYDRMKTMVEHLMAIGKGLDRANDSYNKAVGSMEARVLPSARKFKELGIGTDDDIPVLEPVEKMPRKLNVPELVGGEDVTDDSA